MKSEYLSVAIACLSIGTYGTKPRTVTQSSGSRSEASEAEVNGRVLVQNAVHLLYRRIHARLKEVVSFHTALA